MRKHIYSFITIVSVSLNLISCAKQETPQQSNSQSNPTRTADNLAKADEFFHQRADVAKLKQAIGLLDQIRNPDARNFEVEWKYAKYNYFLGTQLDNDKESDKAFTDGASAAQIAQRLAPDKPDGYFWYAANLGEQAKRSPMTIGIKALDPIRTAMNKVIEIQPDYQNGSAYDALGQLELETEMMGGDAKKATEYLEKGVSIDQNNAFLRLHLAQAYLDTNRKADAKKQLEYILQMKPQPDYEIEFKEVTDEAKKLLADKF